MSLFGNISLFRGCIVNCVPKDKKKKSTALSDEAEEDGEEPKVKKKNKKKVNIRTTIDTDDIIIENKDAVYNKIEDISNIIDKITDIQIYSNYLDIIHVYGEKIEQFNITSKDVAGKSVKEIMPLDQEKRLYENIKKMETDRKHFQKVYAFGKTITCHDYFPLIDKFDNFIGVVILMRKVRYM